MYTHAGMCNDEIVTFGIEITAHIHIQVDVIVTRFP